MISHDTSPLCRLNSVDESRLRKPTLALKDHAMANDCFTNAAIVPAKGYDPNPVISPALSNELITS